MQGLYLWSSKVTSIIIVIAIADLVFCWCHTNDTDRHGNLWLWWETLVFKLLFQITSSICWPSRKSMHWALSVRSKCQAYVCSLWTVCVWDGRGQLNFIPLAGPGLPMDFSCNPALSSILHGCVTWLRSTPAYTPTVHFLYISVDESTKQVQLFPVVLCCSIDVLLI